MASVSSCCIATASLVSTVQPQVFVRQNAAGVGTLVPKWSAGLSGNSALQLQGRSNPCFRRRHPSQVTWATVSEDVSLEEEETVPIEDVSPLSPSSFEVHHLLMELCDETSIAELQLKVGSFKLKVKRDLGKIKNAPVAQPVAPPPVPSKPMVDSMPKTSNTTGPTNAAPPKTSSASGLIASLSKPLSSTWALLESAADEGLLFVKSPKVGYFRKGRVAKGKSGPPLVEEGQVIKEGHVVCYLEQLGTQQPVESDISGEVVKVLWDDGEPVGYGDPLIAIRPSFPGIKKLT